jgi:hypothetical protein
VESGLVLMLAARFVLHSPFFQVQLESEGQREGQDGAGPEPGTTRPDS